MRRSVSEWGCQAVGSEFSHPLDNRGGLQNLVGTMEPLEPPDTHYLSAALGWLELGNAAESICELGQIRPENVNHPDVLEVRWMVLARLEDWNGALLAARELVQQAPSRASGWLHHSYALRRVATGGLQAAWEALLPAWEQFPKEPIIAYNLACYACQLGEGRHAMVWLRRAMDVGEKMHIRAMALADEDLKPLWPSIRRFSSRGKPRPRSGQ